MAKIAVRIGPSGYKGLNPGVETTMSLSRARAAVGAGQVEYVEAAPKRAAKKTATRKTAARKTATKAARSERTRTMAGRSKTK